MASYLCQDGEQFDTDGDGAGDSVSVSSRCQWDKQWSLQSPLPACYITHCVHPFPIPASAHLEEVTAAWTGVNTNKEYECQGKEGGRFTRFWETDRTKSTFSIPCTPDGTFNFVDAPESWPICLEDIECLVDPPEVPSHPDYAVITGGAPGLPRILRDIGLDDGQAFAQSLIYPQR